MSNATGLCDLYADVRRAEYEHGFEADAIADLNDALREVRDAQDLQTLMNAARNHAVLVTFDGYAIEHVQQDGCKILYVVADSPFRPRVRRVDAHRVCLLTRFRAITHKQDDMEGDE